jgi:hypothetical protein
MKTEKPERRPRPEWMRGYTVPHPTRPHLWARPGSTLFFADLGAVIEELDREDEARAGRGAA